MTEEDVIFLNTVKEYSQKHFPDSDMSKLQTTQQLKALRPILQQLAIKHGMDVEDVFIKYLDLSTQQAAADNIKPGSEMMKIINQLYI